MSLSSTAPAEAAAAPRRWSLARIDLRTIWGAVVAVLLLRVAFGLFALPISAIFPNQPLEYEVGVVPGDAPLGDWLQRVVVMPWVRYDAQIYARIADHGYVAGEGSAAFHPLYPLLAMPVARLLGGNDHLALFLVATVAAIAATVVFARYVAAVHGVELATRSAWLLLLAPPSFILLAPYNEGTFLALAIGCLWALHGGRWWLAGLLGGLAALTRQQGIALALPLLWLIFVAVRERRARWWDLGAVGLVPLGYGLFVLYRTVALGEIAKILSAKSPLDLLHSLLVSRSAEKVVLGQRISWPWDPFIDQIRQFFLTFNYPLAIDFLLGWGMVLVLVIGWRRMTTAEALFAAGICFLSLFYYNGVMAPYLSLPRHILLAFPLYVILARWLGTGSRYRLGLELLLVGNLFLLGAYVRHGWVP